MDEKLARRVGATGVCRCVVDFLEDQVSRESRASEGERAHPLTVFLTSILQPVLIRAYDWTSSTAFPNSLLAFLINSFLRTGSARNSSLTTTVVPFDLATLPPTTHVPLGSKVREVPAGAVEAVAVWIERVAVPQREERASPRKPSVSTVVRSEKVVSLEVWCLSASYG